MLLPGSGILSICKTTSGNLPLSSVMSSGNSHEMHGTVQAFMTYILPLRPIKICPLYQVEGVIMKLPFPNSLDSALVE